MAKAQPSKTISLTRGLRTVVSASDYPQLSRLQWRANKSRSKFYAVRWQRGATSPTLIQMHRVIMRAPPEMVVDHINGDSLDNRRENLRIATVAQNAINSPRRDSSPYRGIRLDRRYGKWTAKIVLGTFDTAEEAAAAYDRVASILHGEFYIPNLPK